MKIDLNGSFDLGVGLSKSFAFLTDPRKLSTCVADLKQTKITGDHTFETVLGVKIGPVNGNFNARCDIEPSPPDTVSINIEGAGTASTMHLVLSLKLGKKTEKLTSVVWEATADITGLVSGLGETVLRQLSKSRIEEIIGALKKSITTQ